jgi:AcrR family transcriptional regulator
LTARLYHWYTRIPMVQRDTKRALLDAAATVVAERGVDDASTREIYARAGVKAPTLYHHFGDKEGLMRAVVSDAFERYLAQKRALRPTGDPFEDLRRGWDAHVAFARANPGLYPLMWPAAGGRLPAAAAQSAAALRDGFEEIAAEGWLRPGISPGQATRTLAAALHGAASTIAREPANRGNTKLSETLRDAVIDALLKARDAPGP